MDDNLSKASNGFIFDNTMVRNIRSRGFLIRASDVQISNGSFENVGRSAIAILYGIFRGESGVSEKPEVSQNGFDRTGTFQDADRIPRSRSKVPACM